MGQPSLGPGLLVNSWDHVLELGPRAGAGMQGTDSLVRAMLELAQIRCKFKHCSDVYTAGQAHSKLHFLCWRREMGYSPIPCQGYTHLDRPLRHWWGHLESLWVCQASRTSIWDKSEADNPEGRLCGDLAFKGNEDQKVTPQCLSPKVLCRIYSSQKWAPVPQGSPHTSLKVSVTTTCIIVPATAYPTKAKAKEK